MTPGSNAFYQPGGYYQLPGQFDLQYVQPVPSYSYPVLNKTVSLRPQPGTKKPFYIHVNPVYPTSEKFNILSPYPQFKPASPFPSSTAFPAETTSEYPVTGISKVTPTEEVPPETTPFVTASPETAVPETSPVVTTVSSDFSRPTEPSVYQPIQPVDLKFRQPIPKPVNLLPTSNSFGPYPGFGRVSTTIPGQAGIIVPSAPSYIQPVPSVGLPQSSYLRPEVTAIPSTYPGVQPTQVPASCPCYVMSKNENGQTSTTTQSPVQALSNSPGAIVVMIYPLCPGDSLEKIKKLQPALSSTYVIPYQCGACAAGRDFSDIQQFDTFQEALDKGAYNLNKPTLILNKNPLQERSGFKSQQNIRY